MVGLLSLSQVNLFDHSLDLRTYQEGSYKIIWSISNIKYIKQRLVASMAG